MANLIFSILSEYNGKGLAKGKKDVNSFQKTLKSLGKTLAATFSATAILNFSKNAISAFMKDEAAAKSLATQLQNMGFGFATTEVEKYIANLERSTGVLDDYLRPALQSLITASGSLTQSQKALSVALDVSAATGKSVEEVSIALAKGFSGQTTAISRLGAGIDAATLKTGDMNKIMGLLQNKFKGQALARLNTYAGKMDLLQSAAARASETIGQGLLDSISALSGESGIQGASNAMEQLATDTANALVGFSLLVAQAEKLAGIKINKSSDSLLGYIPVVGAYLEILSKRGANAKAAQTQTNVGGYSGIPTAMEAVYVKEWMAIKKAVDLRKAENAALKAKTAVDQLKDKFDLERIGLTVALNAATDEETKLRLRSQLAILDNNEALSKQLLAQMNAKNALDQLATAASGVSQKLDGMLNSLGRGGDQGPGQALQYGMSTVIYNYYNTYGTNSNSVPGSPTTNTTVNVNAPGIVSTNQITEMVQEGILRAKYEGRILNPAGGL